MRHNVTFAFIETGTVFIKDGKTYQLQNKRLQSEMAHKSGMNFQGRPIEFRLCTPLGMPIPSEYLYRPRYDGENCDQCGSRLICNGCSHCGACEGGVGTHHGHAEGLLSGLDGS